MPAGPDRARFVAPAQGGAAGGQGDRRRRFASAEITVFKSLGNAAQDICLAGPDAPRFDPCG